MDKSCNIFLVGLMGAGKTTIGRLLARHQHLTFVDSDHEIEARTGVRISTIFELEGESGFRAREEAVLCELVNRRGIVLATGGGAILSPLTRQHLHQRGVVVYLRGSVDQLWHRTRHDRHRPLLQTGDPKARLQELFEIRDPLYREVAHLIVDTAQQSPQRLVCQLELELNAHVLAHPPC
ncbi:MAG: shikimate kinase AroK [Ferrovum sp.]|jgi:shikimate kinase|nr:shikimate kinase AroK [Ferrovum sp.]NDU90054.1 shikimate kinase AroK [Ferrovum sp.]